MLTDKLGVTFNHSKPNRIGQNNHNDAVDDEKGRNFINIKAI